MTDEGGAQPTRPAWTGAVWPDAVGPDAVGPGIAGPDAVGPGAVQQPWAAYPGPPPPPPPGPGERRRRRIWAAVVGGWALVLLVLAIVSAGADPPTVREQRSLADTQSIVDRAVADLVRASGGVPAGAIPEIGDYTVHRGCRLTSAWDGAELTRVVVFTVAPDTEDALLQRLATGLGGAYAARVRNMTLRADAGQFVGVQGTRIGPGQVRTTVTTGCRPPAELAPPPADTPGDADRAADQALAVLGVSGAQRRTEVVPCPGGGVARTVTAHGNGGTPPATLARPLGGAGTPVLDQPELYAYRAGAAGVVVRAGNGRLTVTASTGC